MQPAVRSANDPGRRSGQRGVHRGRRFRVLRSRSAEGRPIVVKTPKDKRDDAAAAALRHEYSILQTFTGSASGIARAIAIHERAHAVSLVLDDAGSTTLKDLRLPLDVARFLELATAIAQIFARVHAHGIVHRDVQPSNVVLDATGQPTLVDFDMAVRSPETVSSLPVELSDSLPYVAPELTGRVHRAVDHRADLYSLGVVFYELLTGAPPFRGKDPIGVVHAHLAREPISPSLVARGLPEQLSRIVEKLLAKDPAGRYQTALSLANDLREAQRQWSASRSIGKFELGELDFALELPLPARLYGREHELAALSAALGRTSAGSSELVLVTGGAGIGKSALVRQLGAEVLGKNGRFVEGKFDLRRLNVPYASLIEALDGLVTEVLADPSERERWRARIVDAVGANGRVLTDLLPRLVTVVGQPAALPPLGPLEAQLRTEGVLRAFLGLFTDDGHPLVVFLDDLQWADAASLETLRALASDPETRRLLLVGALRPASIDAEATAPTLERELRSSGIPFTRIELAPLATEDLQHLLTDTFSNSDDVRPLAALVHRKTAGNPFFVRHFLRALQKSGLVAFDVERGAWTWDVGRIAEATITDNVVELLSRAIDALPEHARDVLSVAACAGKRIDVQALAEITSMTEEAIERALEDALREGLLVFDAEERTHRFAHDRVQQAAYARLDDAAKRELHRRMGRRLLREPNDERLFDAVDQLNMGAPLLGSDDEREELAELDARAGKKARATAAYGPALAYFREGIARLPEAAWRTRHALAFSLHRDAVECAIVSGQHDLAAQLAERALERATSPEEKVDIHALLVIRATVRGAWTEALSTGQRALAELGFRELPPADLDAGLAAERRAIDARLAGRSAEALADLPLITNERDVAILRIFAAMQHPAWFSNRAFYTFLTARSVRFVLEHGNAPPSLTVFTDWAMCLAAQGRFDEAEAFARSALALARRFGDPRQEAHAVFIDAAFVQPWRNAYARVVPHIRQALTLANEEGEVRTAAYARSALVIVAMAAGRELGELLRAIDADMPFLVRTRNGSIQRFHLAYRQAVRALKGMTIARNRFDDEDFDEASYLASVADEPSTRCIYEICRLRVSFLLRDFVEAGAHAREALRRKEFVGAYVPSVELNYLASLTFAALADGVDRERRDELVASIREHQRVLTRWVHDNPSNFTAKHRLVEAELARLEGAHAEAQDLYDEAIEAAACASALHEEALGHELAGRHAMARGRVRTAEHHLREARRAYVEWGATEKVRMLDEEFALLRAAVRPVPFDESTVDVAAVVRVVGALSTEVDLRRLLERLLRACIETAGAERAAMIMEEDGTPFVRARGSSTEIAIERTPLHDATTLPTALIERARADRKPLVIDDVGRDLRLEGSTWAKEAAARSILLLPIQRKSELVAVLYCENTLTTHAFLPARVTVLELLTAQMAAVLQNSLLLEKLRAEVAERARAEQRIRFLADAGAVLAESLDDGATLTRLAELVVPALADWCVIDLLDSHGAIRRAGGAHVDPEKTPLLDLLRTRHPPDWGSPQPAARVLRTGRPLFLDDLDDEHLAEFAKSEEHVRIVRELGTRSAIVVPLIAHDRTVGAMTFASAKAGRYERADVTLAWELGRRAAIAVDNARLFREAEDAVRVRDEFLSIAAHELNTPLTSLKLMVQALTRAHDAPPPEKVARGLKLADRQIVRLTRLVDDLLDVSQLQAGRLSLHLEEVDLTEVVRDVVEQLGEAIAASGSTLTIEAPRPVVGTWDRVRLEQVVANLLSNAVKFGGQKPIVVRVQQAGDHAVLVVTDAGIGIANDRVGHIFERFERAVSSHDYGGLGLGLYIAHVIVSAFGGTIAVESALGKGSTFVVDLPLQRTDAHG